ncbi:MAG TPA: hypothetical protein VN132_00285 [Bdellovibrio sp.]|nr:hypothetical protein [Bdellovibrio sp.]
MNGMNLFFKMLSIAFIFSINLFAQAKECRNGPCPPPPPWIEECGRQCEGIADINKYDDCIVQCESQHYGQNQETFLDFSGKPKCQNPCCGLNGNECLPNIPACPHHGSCH